MRTVFDYLRDPEAIYAESFRRIRAETMLKHVPPDLQDVAVRLVHACGMPEVVHDLVATDDAAVAVGAALNAGAPIFTDARMVAEGIIRRHLPALNDVVCLLDDPGVEAHARKINNTRSAAAIDFWGSRQHGSVAVIGNAPTALFRLLENIADGAPRPAAILGFTVGFVGATESKKALVDYADGIPYITLRGRLGGSALAAAAVNAITEATA